MATVLTPTSAAEQWCARYRTDNGFIGAKVDEHDHIIVPTGRVVDSIQMPRRLGDLVREELRLRELRSPIIENTRTGYLMIITNTAPPDDSRPVRMLQAADTADSSSESVSLREYAGLYRNEAIRTVQGVMIPLPGPDDEIRTWLDEPIGHERADFDTVAAITVTVGDKLSGRRHG